MSGRNAGRKTPLDRPLPLRGKNEVGLSAFAFLFSEFIQYSQQRVDTGDELEHKCVLRVPHSVLSTIHSLADPACFGIPPFSL
jgi:hypothetical protein